MLFQRSGFPGGQTQNAASLCLRFCVLTLGESPDQYGRNTEEKVL
ncbi:hypothetical protein CLOSTHATH_00712 [Hungatella hathewayi DSM 13479]|uniref:Uncharacterized protein n=1 Tax=Hungatella hathewayi DSM 13479 TaxID=566550 RepID=D3AAU1_9FIRM|nr:hypothetical protein CLOSTHATH_00712 [Hungatella hathewayi DSM 13479]